MMPVMTRPARDLNKAFRNSSRCSPKDIDFPPSKLSSCTCLGLAGLLDWGFFARGTNGPTAKREWRAEPQLLARKAVHKRLAGRKNRPKAESGQLSQMESTKRTVGICRTRAGA